MRKSYKKVNNKEKPPRLNLDGVVPEINALISARHFDVFDSAHTLSYISEIHPGISLTDTL